MFVAGPLTFSVAKPVDCEAPPSPAVVGVKMADTLSVPNGRVVVLVVATPAPFTAMFEAMAVVPL